jgi:hypothetical protein
MLGVGEPVALDGHGLHHPDEHGLPGRDIFPGPGATEILQPKVDDLVVDRMGGRGGGIGLARGGDISDGQDIHPVLENLAPETGGSQRDKCERPGEQNHSTDALQAVHHGRGLAKANKTAEMKSQNGEPCGAS